MRCFLSDFRWLCAEESLSKKCFVFFSSNKKCKYSQHFLFKKIIYNSVGRRSYLKETWTESVWLSNHNNSIKDWKLFYNKTKLNVSINWQSIFLCHKNHTPAMSTKAREPKKMLSTFTVIKFFWTEKPDFDLGKWMFCQSCKKNFLSIS